MKSKKELEELYLSLDGKEAILSFFKKNLDKITMLVTLQPPKYRLFGKKRGGKGFFKREMPENQVFIYQGFYSIKKTHCILVNGKPTELTRRAVGGIPYIFNIKELVIFEEKQIGDLPITEVGFID